MKLLWPDALWVMILVPAFLAAFGVRVASARLTAGRDASGFLAAARLARNAHPVSLLFLSIGFALGALALTRPHASITMPIYSARLVLALDVSESMSATDVRPRRIDAAKKIARDLTDGLPEQVQVGLLSFAHVPLRALAPTHNKADIVAAIERLEIRPGTSVGTAIAAALAMLYPEEEIEPDAPAFGRAEAWWSEHAATIRRSRGRQSDVAGTDESDVVVLFTDGQSSAGAEPREAARLAASLGVRIFPIGIGTAGGQRLDRDGWTLRVGLDEATLREIAQISRGAYSRGETKDLARIGESLRSRLAFDDHYSEITGLFALAAAGSIAFSGLLSVRLYKRIL
jgi:Ca-activated chloride channel family protein